jgi:HK97 family phage major capsid protein
VSELAKRLNDERLNLNQELRNMNAKIVEENRTAYVGDEKIKYENLHNKLDEVDHRLRELIADEQRSKETDEAFASLGSRPSSGGSFGGFESREMQQFNVEARQVAKRERSELDLGYRSNAYGDSRMGRALRINSGQSGAGRPMSPTEARTLFDNYVGGGTPGSFTNVSGAGLIPIDFYDTLVSYLIEVSGLMQTGPTVLNTSGGEPLQIPYVINHTGQTTAGAQVSISAQQGAALPSADPGFGQKTLTSNKFGILVQVARELIDDSGVNLLSYLATSAGRAIGNFLGTSLVNGTNGISGGVLSAPIAVTGGLSTSVSANYGGSAITGAPSYNNLIDMEYSVIAPYRQSRSCYWLAADKTLGLLRKLTDNQNRPLWEPSTVLGAPDLLLGKPIVADPFMPAYGSSATSIVFGDFSQYVVRLIGGVRFERSDDFAFNTDLVSFRAIVRADGQLLNPPTAIPSQPLQVFKGGAS